jgi:hypothetical protein
LDEKEYEYVREDIEKDWHVVETRLLAEVSGMIWGKTFLYKKMLDIDKHVSEALNHIDEAKALLSSR